jgi:hypothetical protein
MGKGPRNVPSLLREACGGAVVVTVVVLEAVMLVMVCMHGIHCRA